jgi:hypothetical protein
MRQYGCANPTVARTQMKRLGYQKQVDCYVLQDNGSLKKQGAFKIPHKKIRDFQQQLLEVYQQKISAEAIERRAAEHGFNKLRFMCGLEPDSHITSLEIEEKTGMTKGSVNRLIKQLQITTHDCYRPWSNQGKTIILFKIPGISKHGYKKLKREIAKNKQFMQSRNAPNITKAKSEKPAPKPIEPYKVKTWFDTVDEVAAWQSIHAKHIRPQRGIIV